MSNLSNQAIGVPRQKHQKLSAMNLFNLSDWYWAEDFLHDSQCAINFVEEDFKDKKNLLDSSKKRIDSICEVS